MLGDLIQPTHLLLILVVALVVLGPKRLPEVGRSLGKGIRDFRGAVSGIEEHTAGLLRDDPPVPQPVQPEPMAHAVTGSPLPPADSGEPHPGDYAD